MTRLLTLLKSIICLPPFCARKSESSYLRTGFLTFPVWRQARKKDLNPVRTYRSIQVLFVFTSCGPLAPPFARAEKNLAFACFRPIIRKNPSREAEIDTSAFLQDAFGSKLQICNLAVVYESSCKMTGRHRFKVLSAHLLSLKVLLR